MLASVEELCRKGALAGGEAAPAIFVEGMANLIAAEVDRERLRQMLLALEAKQRLVELLTAYVDGRQQEVRVVVGLDEASPAMQDLVLIGAPARLGGGEPGNGGRDCAHAHPISGDDPGGELHCAALRAHPGGSRAVGSGDAGGERPLHWCEHIDDARRTSAGRDGRYCAAEFIIEERRLASIGEIDVKYAGTGDRS